MSFFSRLAGIFGGSPQPTSEATQTEWGARQRETGTKIYLAMAKKYPRDAKNRAVYFQHPNPDLRGRYVIRIIEEDFERAQTFKEAYIWNDQVKPLVEIEVSARENKITVRQRTGKTEEFPYLDHEKYPDHIVQYVLGLLQGQTNLKAAA